MQIMDKGIDTFWRKDSCRIASWSVFSSVMLCVLSRLIGSVSIGTVAGLSLALYSLFSAFVILAKCDWDFEQTTVKRLEDMVVRVAVLVTSLVLAIAAIRGVNEWDVSIKLILAAVFIGLSVATLFSRVSNMACEFNGESCQVSETVATAGCSMISSKPLTDRDVDVVSTHEAGHALAYAWLGSIPSDVRLIVDRSGQSLGSVSDVVSGHSVDTRDWIQWKMLFLLAGGVAEEFARGEKSTGSTEDSSRWVRLASDYLATDSETLFFYSPSSNNEMEWNEKQLLALRKLQTEALKEYFKVNESVFFGLRAEAMDKRELGAEELSKYLERVVITKGFPGGGRSWS